MQCSLFPGFISDVSTQRNSIFHIVLGFNGGNLKKNALKNIFFFYWKCILFKTFHIKTQNNTEIWIPLGTNITNEVRKDWTLHFHPQGASMFLNERTIQFFGLVQPLTVPKWKKSWNVLSFTPKYIICPMCKKKLQKKVTFTHPTDYWPSWGRRVSIVWWWWCLS